MCQGLGGGEREDAGEIQGGAAVFGPDKLLELLLRLGFCVSTGVQSRLGLPESELNAAGIGDRAVELAASLSTSAELDATFCGRDFEVGERERERELTIASDNMSCGWRWEKTIERTSRGREWSGKGVIVGARDGRWSSATSNRRDECARTPPLFLRRRGVGGNCRLELPHAAIPGPTRASSYPSGLCECERRRVRACARAIMHEHAQEQSCKKSDRAQRVVALTAQRRVPPRKHWPKEPPPPPSFDGDRSEALTDTVVLR
jgi:hypothetical protein